MYTRIIILLIFLWLIPLSVAGQSVYNFCIGGGLSNATGEDSKHWNTGYNLNFEWFMDTGWDNIKYGLRFAYNQWSANSGDSVNKSENYTIDADIEQAEHGRVLELIALLRYEFPTNENKPLSYFLQLGIGSYLTLDTEIEADEYDYYEESEEESGVPIGLGIGAGIILNRTGSTKYAIYPIYNKLSLGAEEYFTLNMEILFDL